MMLYAHVLISFLPQWEESKFSDVKMRWQDSTVFFR